MDRSRRGVDASHLITGVRTAALVGAALLALAGGAAGQATPAPAPHIVLVGDSTVTEGSGWGLGFRQLVASGVRVTNTAQNGRSSKSFRDEGHWATALAVKGDYYLIQFGHNDQPGKGPERETDPSTTFPANLARYVDEVRAIGATPVLVTSLVRRTFRESRNLGDGEPARLRSTLGPWVEAVRRVSIEKRVPLIDLDASSRAVCEQLGPVQCAGFNLKTDAGTWDTTHLDAAGSAAFAGLVVDSLRDAVPALAPYLAASGAPAPGDPPDLPAPHPLLSPPNPIGPRVPFGRVYTRAIRLARIQQRQAFLGREPSQAALPPMVTSPVILVAWDFVPDTPPVGRVDCGFGPAAPREVFVHAARQEPRPELQPLATYAEPRRIKELLEPFESDIRRVRWVTVLDSARLRPDTFLAWQANVPCGPSADRVGEEHQRTQAFIAQDDIDRWIARAPAAKP
jgi:lysophospholipase L1-like esterase